MVHVHVSLLIWKVDDFIKTEGKHNTDHDNYLNNWSSWQALQDERSDDHTASSILQWF